MKSSAAQPLVFDRATETVHGRHVVFCRLGATEIEPFVYVGKIDGVEPAMWTASGRWREDEAPHPHDLAIAASR